MLGSGSSDSETQVERRRKTSVFNNSVCSIEDLPQYSYSGVAEMLGGRPTFCGGRLNARHYSWSVGNNDCWQLQRNGSWTRFTTLMNNRRLYHRSVSLSDDLMWVIGGLSDYKGPRGNEFWKTTTELVHSSGKVTFGPDTPYPLIRHCAVMTNDKHIYIMGGMTEDVFWNRIGMNETLVYRFDGSAVSFSHMGPSMNQRRWRHGCGTIYSKNHNGRQVILVVGGSHWPDPYYPELLDYSVQGATWTLCKY